MDGLRLNRYSNVIESTGKQIGSLSDMEQVAVLHELIDDTPYKTENYNKYVHDEYYISHNKSEIIKKAKKRFPLTIKKEISDCDLIELVSNRKSLRDYANCSITFEQLSTIVHYSLGIKSVERGAYGQRNFPFRFCNSAGGLNHLDLYLLINNVDGIESGVYYYDFIDDSLIQMDYGNMRSIIGNINYQNEFSVYSNFLAVVVSDLSRIAPKYCKRAYRMAHVDGGIVTAYLQMLGESVGVSSCVIAGFLEHELEKLLKLTESDYPIDTISFGVRK